MPTYHILYNPLAGDGTGAAKAETLKEVFLDGELSFHDITKLDINEFISESGADDKIVISGGDGTLSRFVNTIYDNLPEKEIYYHAAGSGNDFAKDIALKKNEVTLLNPYLKKLPVTYVKGEKYRFINGVGFGIDGYCCDEGEKLRAKGKSINYTAIAIKGVLFFYNTTNATITVDGVTKTYKNVWMIPTMFGRYYGGGMMACPLQSRANEDGSVSAMVVRSKSRFKLLTVLPRIFGGTHIKVKSVVETFTGHEVTVSFDRPTALQIDGETIRDVLSYTVKSEKALKSEEEEKCLAE